MRLLHFSDLHIGVETYGRSATEGDLASYPPSFAPGVDRRLYLGLSTRLLDFLWALDRMVEFALQEGVDLVLFCGDAYKSRDPSQTHQREFARRIARLVEGGVPVFMVAGNHDVPPAPGRATALDIFPVLKTPLVTVADRLKTYRVQTRSGPLQVVAVPWVRRGALLSRDDLRGRSPEALREYIEAELTARIQREAEALDPSLPAVLAGHFSVAGAELSSERAMLLGWDYTLQRSDIAHPAFSYVALGHIHRHQCLWEDPPVVYPGSVERVDFGEEGDEKGFCLVEIDPARPRRPARWEFLRLEPRRFLTVEITVPREAPDPTEEVLRALSRYYLQGAVVRVIVHLTEEAERAFREREVRQALAPASWAGVERRVARERRPPAGVPVGSLAPEKALEEFLRKRRQAGSISEDLFQEALEKGKSLLREAEESE